MGLSTAEQGAYMRLLCLQWSSKDIQAIADNPQRLTRLTEGNLTPQVRAKFTAIEIAGQKFLRNERLAGEWTVAKSQHNRAVKANNERWGYPKVRTEDILDGSQPEPQSQPESKSNTASNGGGPHAQTRSVRTLKADEEYLRELQAKPAYRNLNVALVYGKMVAWCEVKGKQPTRARLVNWLNREDQPMKAVGKSQVGARANWQEQEQAKAKAEYEKQKREWEEPP